MIVKNVLKNAINYLGLTHLLNTNLFNGSGAVSDDDMAEINSLINCLNLVVNEVASEYVTLKDKVKLSTTNGVIYYSKLSNKIVSDILSVKQGETGVSYVLKADRLETVPGLVEIEFAYQPGQVTSINETIDFANYKLNERVLAYGVVAEYNFLYANYDDATIWDNRFKNSLSNLIRPKREIKIKQRLWV
jgi:hypothetical protein